MTTRTQADPGQEWYPGGARRPGSDNTLQYEWVVTIKGNLDVLFRDDPNVFVAGGLLWYPVEGQPGVRAGPDVLVVFGRPRGHRGSYRQWREGGGPPPGGFEGVSPRAPPPQRGRTLPFSDPPGGGGGYL